MTEKQEKKVKEILDGQVSAVMLETVGTEDSHKWYGLKTQYVQQIIEELKKVV